MDLTDDFTFYLGFTKNLVLNLPNQKDRSNAASWLKKLCEIHDKNAEDTVHVEYLKLLLLAMHGNNFSTFFEKTPPEGDLEPININDVISVKEPPVKSKTYPFVYTSVSGNLCDFVAIQEIPNYGLHGYYAISNEPLSNWIHAKNVSHNKNGEDNFGKLLHPSAPRHEPSHNLEMEAEIVKESENQYKTSSRDILQDNVSRGREIIETRPCWGSNRYIERLIDESPYFISDLELSQTDGFLHNFKDRKMKKVRKGSMEGPCLIPSRRRQVERMMDLPRCAIDPGEQNIMPKISQSKGARFTCIPKEQVEIDTSCVDFCVNEDEDEEDEEDDEDAFLYQKRKYERTPEIEINSRIKNYLIPFRTSERVSVRKYPSSQNETGYVDDGKLNDIDNSIEISSKRKSRFHKSISLDPEIQGKSLGKDFSYKSRRANISLPSHSRNLSPRNESMGSYGPVSSFPNEMDLSSRNASMGSYGPVSSFSNEMGSPTIQSRNFVTLSTETSGQRRKNRSQRLTSQDFVSLRTFVGESDEESPRFENVFPNQRLNSSHNSRRVKFPSEKEIRSYCPDD